MFTLGTGIVEALAPDRSEVAPRSGAWLTDLMLLSMALIWGVNFIVVKLGAQLLRPAGQVLLAPPAARDLAKLASVGREERGPAVALVVGSAFTGQDRLRDLVLAAYADHEAQAAVTV